MTDEQQKQRNLLALRRREARDAILVRKVFNDVLKRPREKHQVKIQKVARCVVDGTEYGFVKIQAVASGRVALIMERREGDIEPLVISSFAAGEVFEYPLPKLGSFARIVIAWMPTRRYGAIRSIRRFLAESKDIVVKRISIPTFH